MTALYGCDDESASPTSTTDLRYDLEGPRGIVRERGPWLTRLGAPSGSPAERYRLALSYQREAGAEAGVEAGVEANTMIDEVDFVASGRPDVLFALIPDLPAEVEVSYQVLAGEQATGLSQSFKWIEPTRPLELSNQIGCLINLDQPDPKRPVTADQDRSPEAGIQRHYEVSVYATRSGELSLEESQYVSGLVTFQWLSVDESAEVGPSTLAPLIEGKARSAPLTTPLGAQRLWVRALTERGARCDEIFEMTSL